MNYKKSNAMLRIMAGLSNSEEDWEIWDLGDKSLRQCAEKLIETLQESRNWISAYPIDGLFALLERGFQESSTAEEKNWFLLQNALLLMSEGSSVSRVRDVMARAHLSRDGQVLVHDGEQNLLQEVENLTRSL
jgi:hypothetical protein